MKKTIALFALALLAMSCEKTPEVLTTPGEKMTLSATIESSTRVEINTTDESTFNHFWQASDQIKVFSSSANADFDIDSYTGSEASFTGTLSGSPIGAIYPAANASAAFDGSNFTVTFPATQTYVENTYDPAANVYVATISSSTLNFKPLSCYIRIALWSKTASTAVDHIVVSSVGGEKIAGPASVSTAGVITMDPSAGTSITLNCTSPVTLSDNSANPTYFYVAVPAVSVENGLKVDVYKEDDSHLWRSVSVSPLDKKNRVLKMSPLEYSPKELSSVSVLTTGSSFNMKIKKLSDDGDYPNAYTDCAAITEIIFETNKNMTGIGGVDVSNGSDGSIKATFNNGIIRIQTAASKIQMNKTSSSLFRKMSQLARIEGFNNLKYVTESSGSDWQFMFRDDPLLVSVDLSPLVVEKTYPTKTRQMFKDCTNLESVQMPSSNNIYSLDAREMFSGCSKLTTIENFRTGSSCSGVDSLFFNCSSLSSLNLANFNTKKVTTAKRVFQNCSSLSTITFGTNSTFELCTTMSYMFDGCTVLASLDLSKFNTNNVTDMSYMFRGCKALTSLDLSRFDTRKVTTMRSLCELCSNLIEIDLSGENCSTEAMTDYTALSTFIFNSYEVQRLKLGNNFSLGSSLFPEGLHHQVLPQVKSMTGLTVYSNSTIATDFLHQIGKQSSNYRAVEAVNAQKLIFKSLDGETTWKYYSDAGLTLEQTPAEVTNTSYVGLGGGEGEASLDEPVANYGGALTGINF